MFTYWFSSPEKINYFITLSNICRKEYLDQGSEGRPFGTRIVLRRPARSLKSLIWMIENFIWILVHFRLFFPLAKSLFQNHVFSFPKRTKRSHYLKKGQARSSIKILNKAKIILIIINGNVDFTIKSLRPCPVSTAPLTRPPIPSCCKLWFPLNDGENRFWSSTG